MVFPILVKYRFADIVEEQFSEKISFVESTCYKKVLCCPSLSCTYVSPQKTMLRFVVGTEKLALFLDFTFIYANMIPYEEKMHPHFFIVVWKTNCSKLIDKRLGIGVK